MSDIRVTRNTQEVDLVSRLYRKTIICLEDRQYALI